ncbi:MAG: hypothetical protein R3229_01180 [Alphaproteobacteria bacterium]|nr:hypothetical protein [Alphaproteobacteria bacterium]
MAMGKSLSIGAVALLLAACSGNLVRMQTEYGPSAYDYANYELYHAGRDTRVEVHGNPFAMTAPAFANAVTDRMMGAPIGRPTRFTTSPGPSAEKNLRVVMAFDSDSDAYDLCNGKVVPQKAEADMLTLRAAWCFGDRQDSMVEAVVGRPKDVDDPRFRDLIEQTVMNLFPRFEDRELIRDNDRSIRE